MLVSAPPPSPPLDSDNPLEVLTAILQAQPVDPDLGLPAMKMSKMGGEMQKVTKQTWARLFKDKHGECW